jgi:hypothetical protein
MAINFLTGQIIDGDVVIKGAQLGFEDAASTGTIYLYNDGAATSKLNIGGTMWVEEAGKVFINASTSIPNRTEEFQVTGTQIITNTGTNSPALYLGYNSSGSTTIQLGRGRTADGLSYIDLNGEVMAAGDYGFRIMRRAGVNAITDLIQVGTGSLIINAQNGADTIFTNTNVGIGTIGSPDYKLEVNGTLGVNRTDGIIFTGSTANGNKITVDTSNDFIFSTSLVSAPYTVSEKIRIANNGAIGIGGANYGTSGQVLTSNGNAAPSWQAGGSGTVTGTGTAKNLTMWSTGGTGIENSPIKTATVNTLNQITVTNGERIIIDKPSSVTSGDPAFQVAQDGTAKTEFGWDDDGGGFAFVYNYSGNGIKLGAAGNNPMVEVVTTSGSESVNLHKQIEFKDYGSGTYAATAAYSLGVDSLGNVVETAGAGGGTVTGTGTTSNLTLWSDGPNGVLSDAPIKLGTGTDSLIMNALSLSLASGDYSIAMGQQSEASGNNSVAMGLNGTASGAYSLTAGNNTTASGSNSVAMGQATLASSSISTAFGNGTTASGLTSTAMGSGTTASGHRSTATGRSTTASGEVSFSMGYGSIASGDGSFAGAGVQTSSDDGGEATGKNAFAFGYLAKATADAAIAIGSQTQATATNSVALGNSATSSGVNSFAAGLSATASGQTSTALGASTIASGNLSFACGDNTTASGNNSFAAGKGNTASGAGSIVMGGVGTGVSTAAGEASAVLGGESNTASGSKSTILGGQKNSIDVNSQDSSIVGGEDNEMEAGSTNSVVLGGIGLLGGGTHQTTCGVANVSKNNCKFIVGVGTYTSPTNITRENGLEVRDSGQIVLGKYTGTSFNPVATNSNNLLSVNSTGDVQQSRTLPRGIKVGPDPTSGTIAANVGAIRYREDGNNSYVDMIMKVSAFNYAWVNIVENNWT